MSKRVSESATRTPSPIHAAWEIQTGAWALREADARFQTPTAEMASDTNATCQREVREEPAVRRRRERDVKRHRRYLPASAELRRRRRRRRGAGTAFGRLAGAGFGAATPPTAPRLRPARRRSPAGRDGRGLRRRGRRLRRQRAPAGAGAAGRCRGGAARLGRSGRSATSCARDADRSAASCALSSIHFLISAIAVGAAFVEPNPECSFSTTTTIPGSSAGANAANQAWSRSKYGTCSRA